MEFKKWQRIKNQVLLGFLLLIILILAIGTISIYQITMLGELTSAMQHPLEVSNASLRAGMGAAKMHRSMKGIVLANDATTRDQAIYVMSSEEEIVYKNLDIVRSQILGDAGRELGGKSRVLFDGWKPIREEIIKLTLAGRRDEAAQIIMGEGADHAEALEKSLLALASYARTRAASFIDRSYEIQQKTKRFMLFFIVSGILLSWGIAFITLNRLYYSIKKYKQAEEEKERLIEELQEAMSEVKKLSGFLPICANCKKIRDDRGYWNQIESYIKNHSEAQFSHSMCPECAEKLYPNLKKRKTNTP